MPGDDLTFDDLVLLVHELTERVGRLEAATHSPACECDLCLDAAEAAAELEAKAPAPVPQGSQRPLRVVRPPVDLRLAGDDDLPPSAA